MQWLPDLAAELTAPVFAAELDGRSRAVSVRAGYLLSGLRPDLAATNGVRPGCCAGRMTRADDLAYSRVCSSV